MLQEGGARLCTMIHWAPLPLEFLVRMAPLPSAGEMVAQFRRFQKVGLATSYTVLRD